MSGGLSTANFMSGLASGLNTGMGLIDARRRHEREDKAAERADKEFARREELWEQQDKQLERQSVLNERQDTEWQQKQDDRKRKELEKQFERDVRGVHQGIVKFDGEFIGKYKELGLDRIADPQWRAQSQDVGRATIEAMDEFDASGSMGEKSLTAIGKMLQPQLDLRTQKDGLGRKVKAARRLPDGRMAFELEVVGKDGKPYIAPLTKQGSSSMEDEVITVSPEKMQEWATVSLHQANAAYLFDKTGGDNKKIGDFLSKYYFGKSLAQKPEYSYKQGYDQNGNKTLYQLDGRGGAVQVGGSAAPDGKNRDKMAANDKVLWDAMAQYQKDAVTDPHAAADALTNTIGVPSQVIMGAMSGKRRSGDYSPLTYAELNEYIVNTERGLDAADKRMRQEQTQASTRSSPSAPPRPEMTDPLYPDAARQRVEAAQSAGIPAQAPRANPREQAQADLQRQLNNARTPEEQQAIIKKMAGLASSQATPSSDADRLASF